MQIIELKPEEAALLRRAFEAFAKSPPAILYSGKIQAIAELHGVSPDASVNFDAQRGVIQVQEPPMLQPSTSAPAPAPAPVS